MCLYVYCDNKIEFRNYAGFCTDSHICHVQIPTYSVMTQGRIQDFLREGASQANMTDVQSQKSAEELPNMHTSANWVSWQDTTGLSTALIEYLTVLLEYLDLLQYRWQGTTGIW